MTRKEAGQLTAHSLNARICQRRNDLTHLRPIQDVKKVSIEGDLVVLVEERLDRIRSAGL